MDTQEKAVAIVDWLLTHWPAALMGLLVVVITAFLISALTQLRKRYISKKTEEKVEGWVIQKTLALFAVVFGILEYSLPFVQQNIDLLKNIKWVGGFVLAFYASANYLYAFKFNKVFKSIESYLEARRAKLEAKKAASDVPTVQPQPQEPQPVLESDSPFEVPA